MLIQIRCLLTLFAALVIGSSAIGDVIPYSGAEVARNIAVFRVENDGVRLELEVYPEDFEAFASFLPNEVLQDLHATVATHQAAFGSESESILVSRTDRSPLSFKFVTAENRERIDRASPLTGRTDPITGRIIPAPPEDPQVIYIEAFFGFDGARPETLIFRPPTPKEDKPATSIGFMVFDRAVPVTKFSYFDSDARLEIDWSDPWFTAFTNVNLNRSAQSGTTSFLYVAPREVRHEILIRLRELAPWIDMDLGTGSKLNPSQQETILDAALNAFKNRNPVIIAGEPVQPTSVRGAFLTLGETGVQVVKSSATLLTDTAFAGLILSYPISTLPAEATVTWDMFDQSIQHVPVTLTDVAGPFLDWATPEDPEVSWINHLKRYVDPEVTQVQATGVFFLPIWTVLAVAVALGAGVGALLSPLKSRRIGFVLLAAGSLVAGVAFRHEMQIPFQNPIAGPSREKMASETFSLLLANSYVAALEVSPEARRKALEPIVRNTALTDVAAELETNLAIRVPGGSRAQIAEVTDVAIVEGDIKITGAFEGVAKWIVDARAGHWGHDHRRRVEYRARVEFRPERGVWKLTGITVMEARAPDV
ncbi:hypothetical protein RUE5091_03770 [Ruegeria denitrificans]|uniref:Uncharacterized protein n=1 Tax=Ruegeria denitrificans TaxID=1715692 RepID=A0A0P1IXS9_9RHOB|nr:hypothetical protein RUE5091_03770 [Ruegeria denitrificans]